MGLAITVNTDITCINQTNTRKVHTACANILALPEAPVSGAFLLPEEGCILNKKRTAAIIVAAILGLASLLYLGGVLGQLQENYEIWIASGGITGQAYIQPVNWMPSVCFRKARSIQGIKSIGMLLLVGAAIILYLRFHDKFGSKDHDERGFSRSKYGTYGTAAWMADKEMKEILEIKPPERADGIILGEKNGNVVCLPKDTRLNRHIAVFGASGTRKSRGVIRPALFTILKRGESAVITDPKAELYNDNAMLANATISEGGASAPPLAYTEQLTAGGVMAYVDIPKINVYLPVQHGTGADTLEKSVGHVVGTSLPVGGSSTHAVLSAHSGMASSKLFSDIDQLAEGDMFYIHVLGDTLAYEVDSINTVVPTDTSLLQIEEGKDLVTLVTCTPFGVNTHRLLVQGHRVPYVPAREAVAAAEKPAASSWTQHYLTGLGIGLGAVAVVSGAYFLVRRKRHA